MKKLQSLGMGAVVATAAFGLFALTANAQQPPAAAPAGTVAPVKPAVPPAAPPAAKAPATAAPASTAPAASAAKPKKVKSACAGLDETACKANTECSFIVPTAVNAKTGKVDKPYCRKVAGVAAKPKAAVAPATAPATKPPAAPAVKQ